MKKLTFKQLKGLVTESAGTYEYSNRLYLLAKRGTISWRDLASAALQYMSEDDVVDMVVANGWGDLIDAGEFLEVSEGWSDDPENEFYETDPKTGTFLRDENGRKIPRKSRSKNGVKNAWNKLWNRRSENQ